MVCLGDPGSLRCSVFQECVDIDECVDLPDSCVSNSVCINTVVSPSAPPTELKRLFRNKHVTSQMLCPSFLLSMIWSEVMFRWLLSVT